MPQSVQKLSVEIKKTVELSYLLYLPKSYQSDKNKKYPLVFFLHGAGERGDDIDDVKVHGIPKLLAKGSAVLKEHEFIAVSPQCPENWSWVLLNDELDGLFNTCVEQLRADTGRIYMTGLSMGGFGTWHFARRHPNALAAIAPICGGTPANDKLEVIKHLPVWVFHGGKDETVRLAQSADAVAKLNELGGNVKFTVYPGAGHDSWTETYKNPKFYQWLFAQKNEAYQL